MVNGNPQYTLLGRGRVPIFEAIDVLAKANYKGYYSFEWEKLWHPEIAEPEVALADYPKAMRQHFTYSDISSINLHPATRQMSCTGNSLQSVEILGINYSL